MKDFLEDLVSKREEVHKKTSSKNGKFTVLVIDKFSHEDFVIGKYDTAEEALRIAREKTRKAMPDASHSSVATVFYAYGPQGNYLGGDVWNKE